MCNKDWIFFYTNEKWAINNIYMVIFLNLKWFLSQSLRYLFIFHYNYMEKEWCIKYFHKIVLMYLFPMFVLK